MKIAVLSDIHGHWPALQATAEHIASWQPDAVIVNGDVVNRGPSPEPCWAFVRQQAAEAGWLVTRGNHEDYVAQYLPGYPADDPHELSRWTFARMAAQDVAELAALPLSQSIHHPQGGEVRAVHASVLGTRYGIWHTSPESEVAQQVAPAPAVFCTGHVHFPFVRLLQNGTLVVNSGSAGTVCDHGDTRATYAQLVWHKGAWTADIIRLPYDRAQTERDYHETGLLEEVPIAPLVFAEWQTGWPIFSAWGRDERWRQRENEVGMAEAVREFLAQLDLPQLQQLAHHFWQGTRRHERGTSAFVRSEK